MYSKICFVAMSVAILFGLQPQTAAAASGTPFPYGTYVWPNPVAGDTGNNKVSDYAAQINAVASVMGAPPSVVNTFTDFGQDWPNWVNSAAMSAKGLRACENSYAVCQGIIPVVGLPMVRNADWNHAEQVFKDTIAGVHDDVWTGVVKAYRDNGFKTIYVRIGYEHNGGFMPWAANYAHPMSDWIAAYQHIADAVHSVSGITVKTIWNPAGINWTGYNVASTYPGDSFVDVIGVDQYSPAYPLDLTNWDANGNALSAYPNDPSNCSGAACANHILWVDGINNRRHFWSYPNGTRYHPQGNQADGWSVLDTIALAKQHGKPMALPESGAGAYANHPDIGVEDDPEFPKWLAETLIAGGVPIEFVMIWDINAGDGGWKFTGGNRPKEAAAWAQYFGNGAGGIVDPVCGPANGQTLTAAPTTGLCSVGTPTAVLGTGPWSWTCQSNSPGSTPAACSAAYKKPDVANIVTVNMPSPLVAGNSVTITGKETDPTQPVWLYWRTYGVPAIGSHDWVQASVDSNGNFTAALVIDHPGTQSTMYYRTGSGQVIAAWSGVPQANGSGSNNVVTVTKPASLSVGTTLISGTESDPTQSVWLNWHTHGVPTPNAGDWVRAAVDGSGHFTASVVIDHAGINSTMYVRAGNGPVTVAWTGTPQ